MNLYEIRKKHKVTQEELSKIIGTTVRAYSNWEAERNEPSCTALIKIADYYGCSTDYLLGRVPTTKEMTPLQENIITVLNNLSKEKQNSVLDFAKFISIDDK